MSGKPVPVELRFWKFVEKGLSEDDCWGWNGAFLKGKHKYGQIGVNGKTDYAHRVSYRIHYGEIPDGLFVLHKCDNPPCSNPRHLFVGTDLDNMRDMAKKGRRGRLKLSADKVSEIRRLLGSMTHDRIADIFGVSRTTITAVARGQNWKITDG